MDMEQISEQEGARRMKRGLLLGIAGGLIIAETLNTFFFHASGLDRLAADIVLTAGGVALGPTIEYAVINHQEQRHE